jgi:hypothetical protein
VCASLFPTFNFISFLIGLLFLETQYPIKANQHGDQITIKIKSRQNILYRMIHKNKNINNSKVELRGFFLAKSCY